MDGWRSKEGMDGGVKRGMEEEREDGGVKRGMEE